MRTIVWFRGKDLRVSDHEPLLEAVRTSSDILCLFVLDPYFFSRERARRLPHRMQFLLDSLESLAKNIDVLGSELVFYEGKSVDVVPEIARAFRADRVLAQRWTEPFGRERDRRIKERLSIPFDLLEGELLHHPGSLKNGEGRAYSVFSPFARAFHERVEIEAPKSAPKRLPKGSKEVRSNAPLPRLSDFGISRNDAVIRGGEREGRERLKEFLVKKLSHYDTSRDQLGEEGTSRLSADLKFGTLSPRTVWHAIISAKGGKSAIGKFQSELVWREFSHAILFDQPELLKEPFRSEFRNFPYEVNDVGWRAWVRGETGYPVVDASARQLFREGYVHNRARMVSASFLTKHLLIDYKRGEAHYLEWLVDGDWAQNNAGWQWSAGSGSDAQAYFRIFNPVTQGEKFDPTGRYVKKYLRVLERLPHKYVHAPWTAPKDILSRAGIQLGVNYPFPIVDHKAARARFLEKTTQHFGRAAIEQRH